MGISLRIFLVGDDDSLNRIKTARFERLCKRTSSECIPEFAGKKVRCAIAVVEIEKRCPVRVIHLDYSILTFDSDGRLDPIEMEKEYRLAAGMVSLMSLEPEDSSSVVDARHVFAQKSYLHQFKWTPSPAMVESIVDAALTGVKVFFFAR